ncbi:PAS domain-containing protein [Trichothermofontia sichuanensis B231]|uniref:GAF domain-containing protein n=1 Tax=Trichothermofontia sichuanensis TaxID=3045816 RepID=UPI0022477702|nr:GAF domain-containing protein [Trichothermofontia sichuanensis]UZQ55619.1 PAS domain-containing protein [Trichothermofontia sichuanensis B231]
MPPRPSQAPQSGEAVDRAAPSGPGWLSPPIQAMFAGAFDALLVVDNGGRCVAVNRAACELWELPPSALCDRAITDFTDPNDALGRLWPLSVHSATLVRGEGCLYCSPTHTRQVAFTLAMNTWPDYHLLTLCDRSQAWQPHRPKASQYEHREYQPSHWLEIALDAIPDPIFLKDAQGRWQLVNQAALDLLQLTRSDYQGHTDAELAEQMPFYREALLACIGSDEAAWAQQGLCRTEVAIPQPTGEMRTFDIYKVPLFHVDGTRRGIVVVGHDISDRKQAETNLRRYERIVAAIPDGMALVDRTYHYQAINQTYLDWHQKTAEQVVGHPVTEILGEECFNRVIKAYLDNALAGQVVHYQEWFTYPSLGPQFMGVTYAPCTEESGAIAGVVIYQRILTELKRTEMTLQQLAKRESLLATINNRMRQSLDLKSILQTVVTEVRTFLQTDRVLVYRFNASGNGTVIAESVADGWLSLAGFMIGDPCLQEDRLLATLAQGEPRNIPDVGCSRLNACYLEMLSQFQVRANLALPLLQGQRVWGLLIAHHCRSPRHWQSEEIDLLKQLSGQLAIAIQQSELYRQVQDLNQDLEHQVRVRTAELQQAIQFEGLVKRITDKVRDSLDEQQILQTVVQELAQGMAIEGCNTGIYNKTYTTSTITNEFIKNLKNIQGTTIALTTAAYADIYAHLLQGKTCIFGELSPNSLRSQTRLFAILACPIADDQNILGDLWIFKDRSASFNDQEIRLVQQVASQCAIALRQARLYQAAQAQVAELERLNQLKDDFLSTVSHELRTPMSNIKMATQMLEIQLTRLGMLGKDATQEAHTAQVNRYFTILQEECQREITLINDLLDLTRLDASLEPLHIIPIELRAWIYLITEPFNYLLRSHQQTLEIAIPPTLTLETDITYLERILRELLNNACKYTPPGEIIRITAQEMETVSGTTVELRISNRGIEIPAAEYERIFERFYRIPSQDRWQHGGTGLGLALVKRLVERLGSIIWVESASNHTHFVICLPAHPSASQPVA